MRRTRVVVMGALLTLGLGASRAAVVRAADAPKPAIDPNAIAALQKMGAFLRSLQAMEVQSEQSTDDYLASGQKVELGGTVDLKAKRPNRLRLDITTDRRNERLYYDGRNFTVFQPTLGYYGTFTAPPTIRELVDVLEARYGVDLPLADLFRLGTDAQQLAAIRGASMVGWSTVKGAVCAHYAFHQADVDWEIWIQEGAQPLPRKMVITTTSERSQPQHVAVMTWNLAPGFDDQSFVFTPPPNSQRIGFDIPGAASDMQPQPLEQPQMKGATP